MILPRLLLAALGGGGITSPLQVAGCNLWLDANQLGLSNGTAVTTWTDLSTFATPFLAVSTGPIFTTNVINGKPAVLFANTTAANMWIAGTTVNDGRFNYDVSSGGLPTTVFVVVQPSIIGSSQNSYSVIIGSTGSGSSPFPGMRICAKLGGNAWGTFTGGDLSSGNTLASGTPVLLELSALGGGSPVTTLYQRGSQVAQNTSVDNGLIGATPQSDAGGLGYDSGTAGRTFNGYIAEVVSYNVILSSPNQILVEKYLINKYNL
jgi:hypothetical protein